MGATVTNHTFGPQVEIGIRPVRWGFSVGRKHPAHHDFSPTVDQQTALRALARLRSEGLTGALAELGAPLHDWLMSRPLGERLELYAALAEQAQER